MIMRPGSEVKLPDHIAIIMDGNNRWARARNLSSRDGHLQGARTAKRIINACVQRKVPCLTLFAFSTENWSRPTREVFSLMALFVTVLKRKEVQKLDEANVRIRIVGNRSGFSTRLQARMKRAETLTHSNTGTTVIVAADYGGRWDIVQAAQKIAHEVEQGSLRLEDIDESRLHANMALAEFPDPDLCIRTGGEIRLSNFLLWHFAYTEFYFSDCYWPDFDARELDRALRDYARRRRHFGGRKLEGVPASPLSPDSPPPNKKYASNLLE